MTNKRKDRFAVVVALSILGLFLVLSAPAAAQMQAVTIHGRTAPAVAPLVDNSAKSSQASEEDVITALEATTDPFQLHDLQQKFKTYPKQSETIDKAFAARWEILTKALEPQTLVDGLDFLAVDTKASVEKKYTFSFLLHTTANLDKNYHLTVMGSVFPSNSQYLPEDRRQYMSMQWNCILTDEPTSQWKQGEYHVIRLDAETELIPYNLRLFLNTRDEQLRLIENLRDIPLGWQWDSLDENQFISKIDACDDFSQLYALAPPGPRVSEPVKQAISNKWKSLTAGLASKTLIDGLDLMTVLPKATADDEYTFSFLLKSGADLDVDYHFSIIARVDVNHLQYIKPVNPDVSFTKWALSLSGDPTSLWKADEYHVAQLKVQTKIIPYNLTVMLQTRDAQGKWTGNPGNQIRLGWLADVPE